MQLPGENSLLIYCSAFILLVLHHVFRFCPQLFISHVVVKAALIIKNNFGWFRTFCCNGLLVIESLKVMVVA